MRSIRTILPDHPYARIDTPRCMANRLELWEHQIPKIIQTKRIERTPRGTHYNTNARTDKGREFQNLDPAPLISQLYDPAIRRGERTCLRKLGREIESTSTSIKDGGHGDGIPRMIERTGKKMIRQ